MIVSLKVSFLMATLTLFSISFSVNVSSTKAFAFTNVINNSRRSMSSSSLPSLTFLKRDYPNRNDYHHHHHHYYYHPFQKLNAKDCYNYSRHQTFLMYEPSSNGNDPRKAANDALKSGFWNALEYTEQWITETLKKATEEGKSNPYARKELHYVCEMNQNVVATVASIFRRFREAREMGERHSFAEERLAKTDPQHEKSPLRETQVIIVPFCEYFDSFQAFESVIEAINKARKDSNDFVTDESIEKMSHMEDEWNVFINGASLHPRFGERTPKEIIEEMEQFTDGKVDITSIEKSMRKNHARRSPYPTLIIELQVTPPAPSEAQGTIYHPSLISDDENDLEKRGVLKDIVCKLESIFAKSAALHKKTHMMEKPKTEESFYDAIGQTDGVEEIVLPSSPIVSTQQWVAENDPWYHKNISSFTSADVTHADSAFEFVFSNLAMHRYTPTVEKKSYSVGSRSYLIMPKFVSSSATSLESFMMDVKYIISKIDGLEDRVSLSFMHPEHIREEKRSPAPVLILQWYEDKDKQ